MFKTMWSDLVAAYEKADAPRPGDPKDPFFIGMVQAYREFFVPLFIVKLWTSRVFKKVFAK